MSDLLEKLNVLLRANLNTFLGVGTDRGPRLPGKISPERLGKDVDREIAALRKQIDRALNDEDAMKARLEDLGRQLVDLDAQVDLALEQGHEARARQLVQQMQRQRRRVAVLESELEQHRQATFDLIQHVNTLEALVSDARRVQAEQDGEPLPPPEEAFSAAPDRSPISALSDVLRDVRERIEEALSPRAGDAQQPSEASLSVDDQVQQIKVKTIKPVDDAEVDDELAKRRSRLSKPD